MVERRKFPGPWSVERTAGNHFVVKDANGFSLAYKEVTNSHLLVIKQ